MVRRMRPVAVAAWAGLLGLLLAGDAWAVNYTVNTTADPGDGTCDASECTLREAVNALSSASDQVLFDMSLFSAPYTIAVDSPITVSQAGVVIDGLVCAGCGTVSGTTTNAADGFDSTLAIRVQAGGGFAGDAVLVLDADDITLRGLNIDGSTGIGIAVNEDGAVIEDCYVGTAIDGTAGIGNVSTGIDVTDASDVVIGPGNVVSGNGGPGISISGGDADDVTIIGNIVGLDRSASVADGNAGVGIHITENSGTLSRPDVGGSTPADGNVISGNTSHGLFIQDSVDGDNQSVIGNNVIGTNGAGDTALPNGGDGIRLQGSTGNGLEPREMEVSDNLVSGNGGSGIFVQSAKLDTFIGNAIGTDFAGTAQLGNGGSGIFLFSAGGNDTKQHVIGGVGVENLIAYNSDDGVRMQVTGSAKVRENTVAANSIYGNGGIGVDIEAAASGSGSALPPANTCSNGNAWGNREASAPVISAAQLLAGLLTVTGTACPNATVDIYTADPGGEPESYQGTTTADGSGAFSAVITVAPGEGAGEATALQTDSDDETGEAAAPVAILAPCDVDGDGVDGSLNTCSGPDCNDADATVYPGAPELCNGLDDDCDSAVPSDETDDDVDTFSECEGDCDDTLTTVNPLAPEICDGLDNDCDGDIPGGETDDDGDGFNECADGDCDDGNAAIFLGATEVCDGEDGDCNGAVPPDETDDDGDGDSECADGDCDDGDANIFLGATEICDGADSDCDGTVPLDEQDLDADAVLGCDGDCDDVDANVFPGATEICDGKDSDCDTVLPADELDVDGDGAFVCEGGDCDDEDATVYPGAPELCDGVDNDCDGTIDEVEDNDADGFTNCDGDCDDEDASVFPGAEEVCDGKDNDCDGDIADDELDEDEDRYIGCDGGDCDDDDPDVNVDAEEVCEDGIDNDCDGEDNLCEQPCEDEDLDGDGVTECDGDCDDADASVGPNAPEICGDELDQDCDEMDVPCADVTLDVVPPASCDCEASVGGDGASAWALAGLLVLGARRRRRSMGPLAAAVLVGALALSGCADVGGGSVQTWWGTLPDGGGAATFEAGGGFVAGAISQAVNPELVDDRSVIEVVLAGDRHPLTCRGFELLEAEFQAVEGALTGASGDAAELAGWACQELRGVAREVFGGDDWHAIHALVEPGDDPTSRPGAGALIPGVFLARVVDLSGPMALAPEAGVDGCATRVAARMADGPQETGWLAEAAVSRMEHKSVPTEQLSSVDLGAAVQVGLTFPPGLGGTATDGTVDVTSFVEAVDGAYDTVAFSTEGEAVPSEPCASFSLSRHLAWPDLMAGEGGEE